MGNQPAIGNVSARFNDYYVTGDRIGSGTFAVVKRCYRKSDPKQAFAVKIIDKKNLTPRELVGLKYEIKILQAMEHPLVIKAVDVFEDRRKVKIVLELCEGGDLFDQMLKVKDKRLAKKKQHKSYAKLLAR
ncbi:serine/threonine-protein kinase [Reticulomyxa filosa]|uniref:Serine/threonine-protein kinase n=1 Tax=Reticulomyxa filosa TaxID=46433 RepID=X6P0I0_RETFI|nr:serine/threonine-protein kinase [Reticulomyxa filosa]|eukprot:ETO31584.1 serine/threonine-protein kinase [Reticulomyxa filosa]